MFRLYVWQNQWLMFALLAGAGLVAATLLGYLAAWRKRDWARRSRWDRFIGALPWIILWTLVLTTLFALGYVFYFAANPPNW